MNRVRALLAWWMAELVALLPARGELVLPVPADAVLERTVQLPLAAERNLHAVLEFEMDRLTPFLAADVYFHYAVLARDARRRMLQVCVTAVPRTAVAPLLEGFRAKGLEPSALEAGGRRIALDAPVDGGRAWPVRGLAIASVVLLSVAIALPLGQKMGALSALERDLASVRAAALAAQSARKELERLFAEENELLQRRAQRPAALRIVHELTQLLSDSTWVSHLELDGAKVRIRGESNDASSVLASVERSAVFAGASFEGSVTRDPGSGRERFSMAAGLRTGADSTARPSGNGR
jgi:general secretion pathway protein L